MNSCLIELNKINHDWYWKPTQLSRASVKPWILEENVQLSFYYTSTILDHILDIYPHTYR